MQRMAGGMTRSFRRQHNTHAVCLCTGVDGKPSSLECLGGRAQVYGHLAEELNKRELLYVHFVEPRMCARFPTAPKPIRSSLTYLIPAFLAASSTSPPRVSSPILAAAVCASGE